jgi:hypothetical protein
MPRGCETNPREKENPETLFLYPSDDEGGEEQAEILQTTGEVLRKEPNIVEAAAEHVCIVTAMAAMPKLLQNPHCSPNPLLSQKGLDSARTTPKTKRLNPQATQCGNLSVIYFIFLK